MSFFPIFFQTGGGGGGGGSIWPSFAAIVLGTVGILDYISKPSFYIDLHPSGDSAKIKYNDTGYLHIQSTKHHNTECLVKKGYTVNEHKTWPFYELPYIWVGKDDFTTKQFIKDCKKCNTYTEIDYEFKRFAGGDKYYDATKRLKWSSCRVRRELH